MPFDIRQTRTATGKISLVVGPECESHEFADRAEQIADRFGMVVDRMIVGPNELIWIAHLGNDTFCISWDIWLPEVSIIAWEQTPDEALLKLVTENAES